MEIERPIATRQLTFHREGQEPESVTVTIGAPVAAGDNDWQCPYSIQASSFAKSFRMFGVDSAQALVHTVLIISVELDALARKHGGEFRYFGDTDSAFPAHESVPFNRWPRA